MLRKEIQRLEGLERVCLSTLTSQVCLSSLTLHNFSSLQRQCAQFCLLALDTLVLHTRYFCTLASIRTLCRGSASGQCGGDLQEEQPQCQGRAAGPGQWRPARAPATSSHSRV